MDMDMERMLAEIDTDERNVLHDDPFQRKHPVSLPLTRWG